MKCFRRLRILESYLFLVTRIFAWFIVLFVLVRFFIISPGRVNGRSMEPGFKDDKIIFVDKVTFLLKEPDRFDVIQIVDPENRKLVVKRVIGLPGESVEIKRGKVFIAENSNSESAELVEDYLGDFFSYTKVEAQQGVKKYDLGHNEFFVLGDNRSNSSDSRAYGPVHRSGIVGRVIRWNFD